MAHAAARPRPASLDVGTSTRPHAQCPRPIDPQSSATPDPVKGLLRRSARTGKLSFHLAVEMKNVLDGRTARAGDATPIVHRARSLRLR